MAECPLGHVVSARTLKFVASSPRATADTVTVLYGLPKGEDAVVVEPRVCHSCGIVWIDTYDISKLENS